MPQTTEERVEHALGKLLEHLLPQYPDEDEDTADQRFDDAFNYALGAIDRQDSPICTPGCTDFHAAQESRALPLMLIMLPTSSRRNV